MLTETYSKYNEYFYFQDRKEYFILHDSGITHWLYTIDLNTQPAARESMHNAIAKIVPTQI